VTSVGGHRRTHNDWEVRAEPAMDYYTSKGRRLVGSGANPRRIVCLGEYGRVRFGTRAGSRSRRPLVPMAPRRRSREGMPIGRGAKPVIGRG